MPIETFQLLSIWMEVTPDTIKGLVLGLINIFIKYYYSHFTDMGRIFIYKSKSPIPVSVIRNVLYCDLNFTAVYS